MNRQEKELLANLVQVVSYDWKIQARPKQILPKGTWQNWLINAGRGFGKTRTGAETVRIWKEKYPVIHIVGPTSGDVRDVMVEAQSGILGISPHWDMPRYEPSKRRLTWNNGAKAVLFSADEPDRLRGPQCYKAWADELAAWRYEEAWDQLQFGLRLGDNPQVVITTTPRPTKIIRELAKNENTYLTQGTSYENRDNLSDVFFSKIISKYEGTRLGRQELNAEILEDVEGALWKLSQIEETRKEIKRDKLVRVVVAIDPAVTSNVDSDETGIIVCGIDKDGEGYVLDDLSDIYTPKKWGEKSVYAYYKWDADRIIAEVNQGGDLVEQNIQLIDNTLSVKKIHAKKGKYLRAEPVAALYEQKKVHHSNVFSKLEDQMTTWDVSDPKAKSPDRVDALVYALTELKVRNNICTYMG